MRTCSHTVPRRLIRRPDQSSSRSRSLPASAHRCHDWKGSLSDLSLAYVHKLDVMTTTAFQNARPFHRGPRPRTSLRVRTTCVARWTLGRWTCDWRSRVQSQPLHCRVQPWTSCSHTLSSASEVKLRHYGAVYKSV